MNNLEKKAKNNEYRDPIIQLPPPIIYIVTLNKWTLNCEGPQTNMLPNSGSIDLMSKNVLRKHTEFCKAEHTTWKLHM